MAISKKMLQKINQLDSIQAKIEEINTSYNALENELLQEKTKVTKLTFRTKELSDALKDKNILVKKQEAESKKWKTKFEKSNASSLQEKGNVTKLTFRTKELSEALKDKNKRWKTKFENLNASSLEALNLLRIKIVCLKNKKQNQKNGKQIRKLECFLIETSRATLDDTKALESSLKAAEQEVEALKSSMATLQSTIESKNSQIQKKDKKLASLVKDIQKGEE